MTFYTPTWLSPVFAFYKTLNYNRWHHVFHVVEWLNGLCFVLSMVMFDTFMVTLCTAITGQLKVVAEAYKRLAHKPVSIRLGRSTYVELMYSA